MAADVLGERVDRHVGAEGERALEDRPEQRVVAHDDRAMVLPRGDLVGDAADELDVDHGVERVRRRLDHDQRDAAQLRGRFCRLADRRLIDAVREADRLHLIGRQRARDQRLGAAIERLRVQDHVARPREGEDGGGDRRHAGGEQRAGFRALVGREPILHDLAVRMVEARIDEAAALAFRRLAPPRRVVEEVAPLLGRAEHEGRGEEHRRLHGAFREQRVVAVAEHQRFGMQHVVGEPELVVAVRCHGRSPCAAGRRRKAAATAAPRWY